MTCQKLENQLELNRYKRQNSTNMVKSRSIRLDFLQRDTLSNIELTTKKSWLLLPAWIIFDLFLYLWLKMHGLVPIRR